MRIRRGQPSFEIAASAKLSSQHYWWLTKVHTDPRFASGVRNFVLIRFCYKTMQAAGSNNSQSWQCQLSQPWPRRGSTRSINSSSLVAVRHTTDQMSRQWSYPWAVIWALSIIFYTRRGWNDRSGIHTDTVFRMQKKKPEKDTETKIFIRG
jgi:hypothetical protein